MTKPTLHFQRFEFKYFIPKYQAKQIISAVLPHMDWDPFVKATGRNFYHVNSLYFDTPEYECFWDKEAGIPDRKKLRFRYYTDDIKADTPIFLEIKHKKDALILKDRLQVSAAETSASAFLGRLAEMRKQSPGGDFTEDLTWFLRRNSLRPKLFITYDRYALEAKRNKEFRVTVDDNIRAYEQFTFGGARKLSKRIYPEGVVFEVKYQNVLPAWFHRLLQRFDLQRLAFSKYANSIRQLVPTFDDNNYQPY